MNLESIITTCIDCAYKVRCQLGAGFLEAVYKNALAYEIRKHNLKVETEVPCKVFYDEEVEVGVYYMHIVVENTLVIELKAIKALDVAHEMQLVNYLQATHYDTGLLINFGTKYQVRRKFRNQFGIDNTELYDDNIDCP